MYPFSTSREIRQQIHAAPLRQTIPGGIVLVVSSEAATGVDTGVVALYVATSTDAPLPATLVGVVLTMLTQLGLDPNGPHVTGLIAWATRQAALARLANEQVIRG